MTTYEGFVTRQLEGRTVMELDTPSVDYRNCEAFKSAIATLVANGEPNLLLNFEKVTFMDSAGLGVVLYGKRSCEAAGGSFSICSVQGYVTNLFKLTNLERAVKMYPNEEVAVAAASRRVAPAMAPATGG